MLDRRVFGAWFALFCERFNREPSSALSGAYYHLLASRMNNSQFEHAAAMLLSSAEFFPTPSAFWTVAELSAEDQAALSWSEIMTAVEHGTPGPLPLKWSSSRVALDAVGGGVALRDGGNMMALRRAFIETFVAHSRALQYEYAKSLPLPRELSIGDGE